MTLTTPTVAFRAAQNCVGVSAVTSFGELATVIPELLDEVTRWTHDHDIEIAGEQFVRYDAFAPDGAMRLWVGVPTREFELGNERIRPDVIAEGHFASIECFGSYSQLRDATAMLLGWIDQSGFESDSWVVDGETFFAARLEVYVKAHHEVSVDEARTIISIKLIDEESESSSV